VVAFDARTAQRRDQHSVAINGDAIAAGGGTVGAIYY